VQHVGYQYLRVATVAVAAAILGTTAVMSADAGMKTTQTSASQDDSLPSGYKQQDLITCKQRATPVKDRGALGVCERHDHDDGLMYSSEPYVDTIIYDSTGEIELESSMRSKVWNSVALSLDKQAPFGILGFHDIKRIGGHFYAVVFDAQFRPDIRK